MFILLYYFSLVFIVLYYLKPENEKLSKQRKINKPVKHKTPLNLRKMLPRIFLVRLRSVAGVLGKWETGNDRIFPPTPTAETQYSWRLEKFFSLLLAVTT